MPALTNLTRSLSFAIALALALAACGVASNEDATATEDAVTEGFIRPVVLEASPLSLRNVNHDAITRPLWGGAFELNEPVAIHVSMEATAGEAGLLFGGRSDPDAEDDRSIAVSLTSERGSWKLRELQGSEAVQEIAIDAPSSAVVVIRFARGRKVVQVQHGEHETSLTLHGELPARSGTYVTLAPGAELTLRDVALSQAARTFSHELGTPLRQLAAARGVSVGTATDVWPPLHDSEFESLLGEQFDTAAPTELYWSTTRGEDEDYFFLPADLMVNYAAVHHQKVNGYFLVWDFELPHWLEQLAESGDGEVLGRTFDEHLETTVGRYKGRMNSWVVVNEAIWGPEETNGEPARYADSIWLGVPAADGSGAHESADGIPAFIERAFHVAHAADPNAQLIYNETGAEAVNAKSDFMLGMAEKLLARRVPIDGIGLQFHLDGSKLPKMADVKANLERIGALGLDVYITELDVSLASVTGSEQQKLQLQAKVYADVLATCLAVPRCKSFTVFGFGDRYAWDELGDASPLLFDKQYEPKPAFFAVQRGLSAPR